MGTYKQEGSQKLWTKFKQFKGNHVFFTGNYLYKYGTKTKLVHDNGIIVLDIDYVKEEHKGEKNDFADTFGDIKQFIKCCNTYTVATAGGGYHLYFKYTDEFPNTMIDIKDKDDRSTHVDLLSNDKYVVGVGTVRDGKTYKVVRKSTIKEMPESIKKYIRSCMSCKKTTLKIKKKRNNDFQQVEAEWQYLLNDELKQKIVDAVPLKDIGGYEGWRKFTTFCKVLDLKKQWDDKSKKAKGYNKANNLCIWDGIDANRMTNMVTHFFKYIKIDDELVESLAPFFRYVPLMNLHKKKPDQVVNLKKIPFEFIDGYKKDLIVKSDTGTGKTTMMKHYVKTHKKPFLSIVSRRSLAYAQCATFAKHGIDVAIYENHQGMFENGKNYIVTIDSIMKACKLDVSQYTLFLDEFNSLVDYLTMSTTLKAKRILVFKLFTSMVSKCERVIAVDADTSQICFDLLDHCGREYDYVYNKHLHNLGVPTKELSNYDDLKEKLKTTEKWLLCCDVAKEGRAIKTWLAEQGVSCVIYTADEKTADIDLDKDDRVIFSPKILYGLDSSMHRDVFTLYTGSTINPANMKQQIARCRNIKTLYFHFNALHLMAKRKPYTFLQFKKQKQELEEMVLSEFEMLANEQLRDIYFKLLTTCEYRDDCYNSNVYLHFKLLLKQYGFVVEEPNLAGLVSDHDKKMKSMMAKKAKEDRFEGVDLYHHQLNDYLNLPRDKIKENEQFFHSPNKVTKHFTVCKYFFDEPDKLVEKLVSKQDFNAKMVSGTLYKTKKLRDVSTLCGFQEDFEFRNEVNSKVQEEFMDYYTKAFRYRGKGGLTFESCVLKMAKGLLGDVVKCSKKSVTVDGTKTSTMTYTLDKKKLEEHRALYEYRRYIVGGVVKLAQK